MSDRAEQQSGRDHQRQGRGDHIGRAAAMKDPEVQQGEQADQRHVMLVMR